MAKMSRCRARELVRQIQAGDRELLEGLMRMNSAEAESESSFTGRLAYYAYSLSGIETKSDATSLKKEIENGMAKWEIEMIYKVNPSVSSVGEVLFELDRIIGKQEIIATYKRRARAEAAQLRCAPNASGEIDFAGMLGNHSKLEQRMKELWAEAAAKIRQIERETYVPDGSGM